MLAAQVLLIGSTAADYQRLERLILTFQNPDPHYVLNWSENIAIGFNDISQNEYALILLDCQNQPGYALEQLRAYRAEGYTSPILAITISEESEYSLLALDSGATDFLPINTLNSYFFERCLRYTFEKQQTDIKLNQLNLYDPLTGIGNRMMFRKAMESAIARVDREESSLALLLINIDGFRKVNESYGNDGGDELVSTMAQRLSRCIRKTDAIARIGADEFILVLDDCKNKEDITLVASKVIDLLSPPFRIDHQPLMVSCSIGISIYPGLGSSVDELLKHADLAMQEAKSQRGSRYCFFTEKTNIDATNRLNIETDLRRALRNNEFQMYYQPRVELGSSETIGMEALIRWHHPDRGLVPPNEFIPIAEETGLIVPIGYWIIQQVCQDMLRFEEEGFNTIDLAINISFKQLQDSLFVTTAKRIIIQSGIDANRLEFELTETAIMSNFQQTFDSMMELSELGVTFSLDDFGTGFSSFAHIQRLPISILKIDRSFIKEVIENTDDAVIVKAIINMAHSLRLEVIAEGVETTKQLEFLRHNQCDQVQGFYYSPALPFDEVINQANSLNMAKTNIK